MLRVIHHLRHDNLTGVYQRNMVSIVQDQNFLLGYLFGVVESGGSVWSLAMKARLLTNKVSNINKKDAEK